MLRKLPVSAKKILPVSGVSATAHFRPKQKWYNLFPFPPKDVFSKKV